MPRRRPRHLGPGLQPGTVRHQPPPGTTPGRTAERHPVSVPARTDRTGRPGNPGSRTRRHLQQGRPDRPARLPQPSSPGQPTAIRLTDPGGRTVATVKKAMITPLRERWTVKVADGP